MKTNKEIDPFGKITDYLSVALSTDDEGDACLELFDGTTTIRFQEIRIDISCNYSKPFRLVGKDCSILLTHKQVETLFSEFLRYSK